VMGDDNTVRGKTPSFLNPVKTARGDFAGTGPSVRLGRTDRWRRTDPHTEFIFGSQRVPPRRRQRNNDNDDDGDNNNTRARHRYGGPVFY